MLVLELLKYAAAADSPGGPDRGVASPPEGFADRQIQWVLDAGMGPLLYHAIGDGFARVSPAWREALLSADLTAQVWHGNLIDAAGEIVDVCREVNAPVTLLKGISISDQYYPAAHLRPMSDIDILIPASAYESVESALLRRGYVRKTQYEVAEGAAHGIPLFHPESHAWVEIHTGLFDGITGSGTFSLPHIGAQSVESAFHGRSIHRLTDELQLLYIAYSWFQDMAKYTIKVRPSCLPPLFDAVYLLNSRARTLDWDGLLAWRDNGLATASLYTMLSYLFRRGVNPGAEAILSRLASGQNIVGALQLRVIHAMLDRYLIGGREWNLALPLPVPGRYSVRHQLGKRWLPGRSGRRPSP